MNAVETRPQDRGEQVEERRCPRCGAALRADQDWCLSCGAPASTRIAPAPNWRTPLAIIAAVLALAAAAIAVAFLELTDDAERVAQAPDATATPTPAATATPAPTETPATGTATATPAPGATATPAPQTVGTWPEGEEAWTVILLSGDNEDAARRRAEELAAGGTPVGVLRSDDFSSLRPGYWVVFSGQYETSEEAEAAAAGLGAAAAGSYVRLVSP